VTDHIGEQMAAVLAVALRAAGRDAAPAPVWGAGLVGMVRAAADQWLGDGSRLPREQLTRHLTDLAWGGLSVAWTEAPSTPEPAPTPRPPEEP
jgi:hypothetical protein